MVRAKTFGFGCVILCVSLAVAQEPKHVLIDWTFNHLTVSGGRTPENLRAAKYEPRMLFHMPGQVEPNSPERHFPVPPLVTQKKIDGSTTQIRRNIKFDWSVNLGNGNVAPYMFPAKFQFAANGTPSCANDYVVYALNVASANNQANMVGINNLYAGGGGICGANPTVNWGYRGSTAAGSILTSPVISIDGKKIAYVESAAGSAIFHVLTWKAGDGSVGSPVTPALPNACTATSSCLVSVTFSSAATTTFASPWVDYQTDKGFVASDDGKVYRISCVFQCALNANPTVDWTFTLPVAGTGGASPRPNGPVYNFPYGYLTIGDQLGEVWVINAGTSTPSLFAGPVMIGGGGCTVTNPPGRTGTPSPCTATGTAFGIPDSVIIDSSSAAEKVFVFTGNDGTAGAASTVVQMNLDLTGIVRVHVGQGGVDMHSGTFDDPYFGNNPSTGELFLCGTGPTDTTPYHYWIGFTNYPTMDSTFTGNLQRIATANLPCAPYTEFFNPNLNLGGVTGHHDLLVSGLVGAGTNGYIITNDISTGAITAGLNNVNYPGGISGVVIDNSSAMGQNSNVYFSTLQSVNVGSCKNNRCAIKLSQASLQ